MRAGNLYFLAGVIPLNKAGNAVQGTTIEEQTRLVLDYIGATLKSQGMSLDNVVMSDVYMKDLDEFGAMNKICSRPRSPPGTSIRCYRSGRIIHDRSAPANDLRRRDSAPDTPTAAIIDG